MTDFLRNLLAPYLQSSEQVDVPSSLADISGFDLGQAVTEAASAVPGGVQGLASSGGITLQSPALQSLMNALGQYGLRPGTGEASLFGPQATYRTYQQQADLYKRKPGVAAPPGHSLHQQGLAIDLPSALQTQKFFDLLRALGWYQLRTEPWHWSYGVYG